MQFSYFFSFNCLKCIQYHFIYHQMIGKFLLEPAHFLIFISVMKTLQDTLYIPSSELFEIC